MGEGRLGEGRTQENGGDGENRAHERRPDHLAATVPSPRSAAPV
jgi:hypothetical protein